MKKQVARLPFSNNVGQNKYDRISDIVPDIYVIQEHYFIDESTMNDWMQLRHLRSKVMTALQHQRELKLIGNSIDAHVSIQLPREHHLSDVLNRNSNHLEEFFCCAKCYVKIGGQELLVEAKKSDLGRCPRCFKHNLQGNEKLCPRCDDIIARWKQ